MKYRMQLGLYPGWKNGAITQQEHLGKIVLLDVKIQSLEQTLASYATNVDDENDFIAAFRKYKNFSALTRGMLVELADEFWYTTTHPLKSISALQAPISRPWRISR